MSFCLKTNSHTSLVWPAKLTSMSHISVLDNLERETKEICKSKEVNSYKAHCFTYYDYTAANEAFSNLNPNHPVTANH